VVIWLYFLFVCALLWFNSYEDANIFKCLWIDTNIRYFCRVDLLGVYFFSLSVTFLGHYLLSSGPWNAWGISK
jgi:hypothetical protein